MKSVSLKRNKIREIKPDVHSSNTIKLRLVDFNIEIVCFYSNAFDFCKDYFSDFEKPDIRIIINSDDFDYEKQLFPKHILPSIDIYDSRVAMTYDYSCLEPFIAYRKIANKLVKYSIILFHGAAIAVNNKCFIFTAPSGTGKTTHIKNWLKMIPGTYVVNGDKPLINMNTLMVYGTPWCGKENMGSNKAVPLSGIIVLKRAENNDIQNVSFKDVLPDIIQQTYIPEEKTAAIQVYKLLGNITNVSFYRLFCNMEEQSALVSYNELFHS